LRGFNVLQFFGFLAKFRKNPLHACKAQMGKIRHRLAVGVVMLYVCFSFFYKGEYSENTIEVAI